MGSCCGKKSENEIEKENEIKSDKPNYISNLNKKEIIRHCLVRGINPNIPEEIIDSLRNSVVRIEVNNIKIFTGFFMKIDLNNKLHNFLLTCNHSIKQEDIDANLLISVYYGKNQKEKHITIKLDKNKRIIKTYEELDVTLIEILTEDNIKSKMFLYPDLNYKNEKKFSQYLNTQIYLAGFPNVPNYKGQRHMSSGIIKKIDENENSFEHSCDTRSGSSGSPIVNSNNQVIGIHYGGNKDFTTNYGYFIGAIIDKLNLEKEINMNLKEDMHLEKENINPKKILNIYPKEEHNNIIESLNNRDTLLKNKKLMIPEIKNGKDLMNFLGPLFNNPNYISYLKDLYNKPEIINLMNQSPIFKNNPELLEAAKNPEMLINMLKEEDLNEAAELLKEYPYENLGEIGNLLNSEDLIKNIEQDFEYENNEDENIEDIENYNFEDDK